MSTAVATLPAGVAGATPVSHASTTIHVSGTVVSLSGATLTFVAGGDPTLPPQTAELTPTTTISAHGVPTSRTTLIPGARVALTEDTTTQAVTGIRVTPPKLSHVSGVLVANTPSTLRLQTIPGNPDAMVLVHVTPHTLYSEHFLTTTVAQLHTGEKLHVDVNSFTGTASLVRITPPKSLHHRGTVVAVTATSVTLRLTTSPVGSLLTLHLAPSTAFSEHALTTTQSSLVVGSAVNVTESLGTASLVRITPPKA